MGNLRPVQADGHKTVSFRNDMRGIGPASSNLGAMPNLRLPWESRMALSQSKKQCAPSVGSHDTVDAVFADECVSAAPIRGEAHSAKENVSRIHVETTTDANKTKR